VSHLSCKVLRAAALGVVTGLTAILFNPGLSRADNQEGWHKFPRRVDLLKPSYKGNYEASEIKTDYYIFQEKVTIDQILRSNGGNVLIVANEVILNAPIDTRVYFHLGPDYWTSWPDSDPDGDWSRGAALPLVLYYSPRVFKVFDSLYLWREMYDDTVKRFIHNVGDRPMRRTGAPPKYLEVPQLPSAQIPIALMTYTGNLGDDAIATDGADAPDNDVNWDNVKSGTIEIYATHISLCSQCRTALDQRIEHQSNSDTGNATFLQASGLEGGRGGAGSLPPCSYNQPRLPIGMRCNVLAAKIGGLSGAPGRGGDAGSVLLHFLNRSPDSDELALLKKATSVSRGRPALIARQRTPNYDTLVRLDPEIGLEFDLPPFIDGMAGGMPPIVSVPPIKVLLTVRDMFDNNNVQLNDPASLVTQSRDGQISIDTLTTDDALLAISTNFLALEASGVHYDIDLLVQNARSEPGLIALAPRHVFETYLQGSLRTMQRSLISQMINDWNSASAMVVYPGLLDHLSCVQTKYSVLSQDIQQYVRRLCQFKPVLNRGAVRSYFYRIGGLFATEPLNVNIDLRQDGSLNELTRIQVLLSSLLDEAAKNRLISYDSLLAQKKERIIAAIQDLEKRRAALTTVAESGDFGDLVRGLGEIAGHFGKAIGAIAADNWVTGGEELYSGVHAFAELLTHATATVPGVSNDADGLTEEIKRAQAGLAAFMQQVAENEDQMISLQNENLKELVKIRNDMFYAQGLFERRLENVFKTVFQDYLVRPTGQRAVLVENLGVIVKALEDPEPPPATIDIQLPHDSCKLSSPVPLGSTSGPAECALIPANLNVRAFISTAPKLNGFPLIVIDIGAANYHISFGGIIDMGQIKVEDMPADFVPW
jgi:hypothetical protein